MLHAFDWAVQNSKLPLALQAKSLEALRLASLQRHALSKHVASVAVMYGESKAW